MSSYGRNRALSSLRADVVFLADLPTDTTTTHVTTANLTDLLNAGIAELYAEIVKAAGENTYRKTQSITTLANTTVYLLNPDYLKLLAVEITTDVLNNRIPLHPFTPEERPYLANVSGQFPDYRFTKYGLIGKSAIDQTVGESIELLPMPPAGKTVTVQYIMCPPRLSLDNDTLDGFTGFEDYAIQYAVMRAQTRRGMIQEAQFAQSEMLRIKENIISFMTKRDGTPAKTQMVRDPAPGMRGFRRYKLP